MASIGEQIIEARKAKGMTQDALSKALNISRSAVAHWETGRTLPDAEMLLRLSEVLEYSFEQAAPKAPEASETLEAPEAEPPVPVGKSRKKWIVLAAALAVAAVCAFIFIRMNRQPKYVVKGTPGEVTPISAYAEVVPNDPDKAYLSIEPTVSVVDNGGSSYQMYDFKIIETNGIGFNIEYITYFHYSDKGTVYRGVFTAQDFRSFNLDPELPPYGTLPFNGGFPKGEFDSTGIVIHGSDANGAPMTFHGYAEFH